MSECPVCDSEDYNWLKRMCPDCGHYDLAEVTDLGPEMDDSVAGGDGDD
jgi:hypothetical protein